MIYIVTGSISSGTSLVSLFLHRLGIDMGVEVDESIFGIDSYHHNIYEDEDFYNLLIGANKKSFPFKNFIELVEIKNNKPYWGFKLPKASLLMCQILQLLKMKNLEVIVIHVFRDLGENYESWVRKLIWRHRPVNINFSDIMAFNLSSLKAYSFFCDYVRFIFVNSHDIMEFPEEFWNSLNVPMKYTSQEIIMKRHCLRKAKKTYSYSNEYKKIYEIMENLKWVP